MDKKAMLNDVFTNAVVEEFQKSAAKLKGIKGQKILDAMQKSLAEAAYKSGPKRATRAQFIGESAAEIFKGYEGMTVPMSKATLRKAVRGNLAATKRPLYHHSDHLSHKELLI